MDFLRDPVWQFVGALIGIVALIISVVIFKAQTNKKELFYEVVTLLPLSSFNLSRKVRSQIIFGEEVLNEANYIHMKIWNGGTTPITTTDFESPLKVTFGD